MAYVNAALRNMDFGVDGLNLSHVDVKDRFAYLSNYIAVENIGNADCIMRNIFWVGVHPGMTDEMIDYMAETIK